MVSSPEPTAEIVKPFVSASSGPPMARTVTSPVALIRTPALISARTVGETVVVASDERSPNRPPMATPSTRESPSALASASTVTLRTPEICALLRMRALTTGVAVASELLTVTAASRPPAAASDRASATLNDLASILMSRAAVTLAPNPVVAPPFASALVEVAPTAAAPNESTLVSASAMLFNLELTVRSPVRWMLPPDPTVVVIVALDVALGAAPWPRAGRPRRPPPSPERHAHWHSARRSCGSRPSGCPP